MKYQLILVDPPWDYRDKQGNDPARGGITYPVLTMKDLYDLPIQNIAEDNSILVCWITFPKLCDIPSPLDCIRNWGFTPITTLFTWVKLNISGEGYYSGLGRYTNSNAEIAVVARRGKGLERKDKSVKQLIVAPLRKHSEKPREQYQRLDRLYGDVRRIELFARKDNSPPDGWDATGLDYDGRDIREFLKQ